MRIAIIGGGVTGLTAGYELAKRGYEVHIFEKERELGGQAGTFPIEGTRLERFYHHLFLSDVDITNLIAELGLAQRMRWLESKVGFFHRRRIYDFVTPMDLLRFKPLSLFDRVRLGLLTLYLQGTNNWRALERITAVEWVQRYAGPRIYETVWGPLLRGKFGEHADEVSMAWLWGKLKVRRSLKGRGIAKELLGYVEGSFQVLIDELARRVTQRGGEIHVNAPVERIIVRDGKAAGVRLVSAEFDGFDAVIGTVPSLAFAKMVPKLPPEYSRLLTDLVYLCAACLVLKMNRSLSRIYWLNISDRDIPFVGAIEHTNYMAPRHYGDKHVLYLSNYLSRDHPLYSLTAEELLREYLPHIRKINPDFDLGWVEELWLFKDEAAQPVIRCGYSARIPDHRTPIPGLYLANTTQIYPEDRGMNYSVRLGRKIAGIVAQDTTGK